MHSERKEIKADHGPERPALGAFHQSLLQNCEHSGLHSNKHCCPLRLGQPHMTNARRACPLRLGQPCYEPLKSDHCRTVV